MNSILDIISPKCVYKQNAYTAHLIFKVNTHT
jgi:hypothetical protein